MVARVGVKPLPYKGRYPQQQGEIDYPVYELYAATTALRSAFLAYLVYTEGGTRLPDSPGDHASVKIGQSTVELSMQNDRLALWMERDKRSGIVHEIGQRFDKVLATGAYDRYFLP